MFAKWRRSKGVIFLGYTPNNAISIGALLGHFPDSDKYCLLGCDRSEVGYIHEVSWVGPNARNPFLKFFSFLLAGVYLRMLMLRYNELSICLPHPDHLVGNFLFFNRRIKKRYIFEDGLLNYYDACFGPSHLKKITMRSRFGWCLGLPYRQYQGFISGIDAQKYDGAFVSFPSKLIRPECFGEIVELSRYERSSDHSYLSNVVLVLDQDIEQLLGNNQAAELRDALTSLLQELGGDTLVKPHYDMRFRQEPDSENWVSSELRAKPAELIIGDIRPKAVVSFISSALINIKEIYPEVRCISVGSNRHEMKINGRLCSSSSLLQEFGIEIVPVASC